MYFSFSPNYDMAGGGKMWLGDGSPRRPSITGILLRLPKREIRSYATYNKNLQFKLTIMWSAVAINDQSVGLKRRATFRSDSEQEIEYPIDPPVELCSGAIYGIAVEVRITYYTSLVKKVRQRDTQHLWLLAKASSRAARLPRGVDHLIGSCIQGTKYF